MEQNKPSIFTGQETNATNEDQDNFTKLKIIDTVAPHFSSSSSPSLPSSESEGEN
jgi:hypothetical protein